LDNASNNDTMVDELELDLASFDGDACRVRCFNHIVNLVAKSILRPFDQGNDANEEELLEYIDDDLTELTEDTSMLDEDETRMDHMDDDIVTGDQTTDLAHENHGFGSAELAALEEESAPVGVALGKVSTSSSLLYSTLTDSCVALKICSCSPSLTHSPPA
jgi:hypothetical protein